MSENCASEIGAAAGCLTTMRTTGAGGGSGGHATGSAFAGRGLVVVGVVVMPPKGRVSKLTA